MAIKIKGYECKRADYADFVALRHDECQPLREIPQGTYFFAGCVHPLVIYRHMGTLKSGRVKARELIVFGDGVKTIGIMHLEPWIRVGALVDGKGRYLYKRRYRFRQSEPLQVAKVAKVGKQ